MHLTFCGAAQEVTGSAHLLTLDDGFTILLDCGMYQGRSDEMVGFNEQWLFNPQTIDCVVLSHAHIDHSGRLPKLYKDGFRGNIYATPATHSLCTIMLIDSAKIQEQDAGYYHKVNHKKNRPNNKVREPLYTQADAIAVMNQFVGVSYNRWLRIHPEVEVYYKDAGHILGSANVTLRIRRGKQEVTLGFTGDIGRKDRPILRDPQQLAPVDYLISESTYGDRLHDEKPAEHDRFLRILKETCLEQKGKLIIPAFSIGKTQELIYMMDQMANEERLPNIPIFVDSPLSTSATEVYALHPECYDADLTEYLITDPNPFGFNNLTFTRSVESSKALNGRKDPCVIISASGMMNAGRVKHHLANHIEDARNTFLMVGYCAPGTQGHALRSGEKRVHVFGEWKDVNARVEMMDSFSAHADRDEMREYLNGQQQKVKQLFLVHGILPVQQSFSELLIKDGFSDVQIPELGQEYTLHGLD
ncbi:MAG: MBL fold metallo-hydrolase [Saprospiraceae bacterium]|nr:MBL fold metallo-hydrolase [Saprospiraceae bacterium]